MKQKYGVASFRRMGSRPYAGAWIETIAGIQEIWAIRSPLTRGRGLKPIYDQRLYQYVCVAPYAGAWIETLSPFLPASFNVAPYAGAWIEHSYTGLYNTLARSPLTRGRGLNFFDSHINTILTCRPLRGAWIKHSYTGLYNTLARSPLTRGRGLKHNSTILRMLTSASPLTRGRGLKQTWNTERLKAHKSPLTRGRGLKQACQMDGRRRTKVAPYAGAWIET